MYNVLLSSCLETHNLKGISWPSIVDMAIVCDNLDIGRVCRAMARVENACWSKLTASSDRSATRTYSTIPPMSSFEMVVRETTFPDLKSDMELSGCMFTVHEVGIISTLFRSVQNNCRTNPKIKVG